MAFILSEGQLLYKYGILFYGHLVWFGHSDWIVKYM